MRRRGSNRRTRWAAWTIGAALPGVLLVGSAPLDAAEEPGAEAWVLRVEVGGTPLLEIGRTSVDPVTGRVMATSLAVGGQGPPSAVAGPETPEVNEALLDWTDDTGSMTVNGGYAQASSGSGRWTARAGLGQGTGTGFPLASELLTWEQQTQLLGAVQSFNDAIAPVADQISTAFAPLLALVGLPVPRLTPMAPTGLVDVGGGRVTGSSAEAAVAPGYATARADAVAGSVKLFGGFIVVEAVSTEVVVERGSLDHHAARSWLTGVQIAGVPVSVDANGIHIINGGPFEAILTPVFDATLRQLATAGVRIRTIATPDHSSCCSTEAVGLEVTVDVPGGPLIVSLGGARATPPRPLSDHPLAVDASPELPADGPTPTPDLGADVGPPAEAPLPAPAGSSGAPTLPRIGVIAELGPDVVRALRLTYLILVGAATAGTAFLTIAGPVRPARPKRGLA